MFDDVLKASVAEIEESYSRYATPMLLPFYRVLNTSRDDLGSIEKRLLDSYESTIKYVVTILISLYRSQGVANEQLEREIAKLAKPSLGMYTGLLRMLLKALGSTGHPVVEELAALYKEKVDSDTFESLLVLSDAAEYVTPKNARSFKQVTDVLVTYRNKAAAHAASVNEKELKERRLPALGKVLFHVYERLAFLAEKNLLCVESRKQTADGIVQEARVLNGLRSRLQSVDLPETTPVGHLLVELEDSDDKAILVDLFPLCIVRDGVGEGQQILFLNHAKKSKIEYISYETGEKVVISSSDAEFQSLKKSLLGFFEVSESGGIPEHLLEKLAVSEESRQHYSKALVLLEEGLKEDAIEIIEHAIDRSPGYTEAVSTCSQLMRDVGRREDAHGVLSDYLALLPGDLSLLVSDAEILIELGRKKAAEGRLREIRAIDPEHTKARRLEELARNLQGVAVDEGSDGPGEGVIVLPHEALVEALGLPRGRTVRVLTIFVSILTLLEAGVFGFYGDLMMAITMVSLGGLLGVVLWATFKIRALLEDSRTKFAAFLKTGKHERTEGVIFDLVVDVFGRFETESGSSILKSAVTKNLLRVLAVSSGAVFLALWFFAIASYSPVSSLVDIAFGLFALLFSLAFVYLISCVLSFHKMLRILRYQRIHFSMVQHPKLSIRYLSHLSRRVSYPVLLVYVVAAFNLYLGPFLANLAFVAALSGFMLLVCYSYYSTIFLVRSVIIQNKWTMISRFSVHFQEPFESLVGRARGKDMVRIKELLEMRNFLDSLDVWAEKKSVLLGMSLFLVGVLLFSTIGMSNIMTRHVVPSLSRYANSAEGRQSTQLLEGVTGTDGGGEIVVRVSGVDDTVIVCWGRSLSDAFERGADVTGPSWRGASTSDDSESGCQRCDWENGIHGNMELEIPATEELNIVLIGYNKVYRGFWLMGGGKFSQEIEVLVDGRVLLHDRAFIRMNTREVVYVAHLQAEREEEGLRVAAREGASFQLLETHRFVDLLAQRLAEESDAAVDLLVGR